MAKASILAVDDEQDILELIQYNLQRNGYHVVGVTSGEDALKQAQNLLPDLILLDLMLPGVDGLDVCKILKNNADTAEIPIIMLTAKGEEADIVTGLELGADDYLTKPFSPRILLARIKAVLRRHETEAESSAGTVLKRGSLSIDPARHQARIDSDILDLTATEFRILQFLAKRPGWVFSRNQIIDAVRGDDYPVTERAVDVQIVGLRKKLGSHDHCIETVRGVGYKFQAP